jgi:hypothetical protein
MGICLSAWGEEVSKSFKIAEHRKSHTSGTVRSSWEKTQEPACLVILFSGSSSKTTSGKDGGEA